MGAKQSSNPNTKSKISLCKTFYLNRSEKFILSCEEKSTEKIKLPDIELYKGSALGYITSNSIIVAGGYDQLEELKTTSYIIDFNTNKAALIAPMPIPCKYGSISFYKSWAFHVGGVIYNHGDKGSILGAPIMKYNLNEKFWVQFSQEKETNLTKDYKAFISLIEPGSFILDKKLYIFGGYTQSSEKKLRKNMVVFSIKLDDELYELKVEAFKFPYAIYRPMTGVMGQTVIIGGGKYMDGSVNKTYLEFQDKKAEDEKFKEFSIEGFEIEENYPPWCTEEFSYFIGFPKIAYRLKNSSWTVINLVQKRKYKQSSTKLSLASPGIIRSPTIQELSFSSHGSEFFSTGNLTMRSAAFSDRGVFSAEGTIITNTDSIDLNGRSLKNIEKFFQDPEIHEPDILNDINTIDLEFITSTENDEDVCLIHKSAIKLLSQVSDKLTFKKLNALELNHISAQLQFKEFVTVGDISAIFEDVFIARAYPYARVVAFIKVIHKIIDRPRLRSAVIGQLAKLLMVSKRDEMISRDKLILILTRVIKATIIGVQV
ncbi:hypothetical protein SteCoe_26940 [Stentor coeruleus]|uniref:Uncharacterized protein n=1 Tax=Stentor coeruleus TaxID=5963 RepID=A0A1R2BBR1_9CILI|nr:hypothetical protein SteCoe_26940 [Stentor coeruleus]